MARKSEKKAAMDRVQASMMPLCTYPEFEKFMEEVRQMKDDAVRYMVDHTSVASERESLVARGEVRAYLWLLETYRGQREQMEQRVAEQQAPQD